MAGRVVHCDSAPRKDLPGITVTGAGSPEVNGVYRPSAEKSEIGGHTIFRRVGGGGCAYRARSVSGDRWVLKDEALNWVYMCPGASVTLPTTGWTTKRCTGKAPVPTFTATAGPAAAAKSARAAATTRPQPSGQGLVRKLSADFSSKIAVSTAAPIVRRGDKVVKPFFLASAPISDLRRAIQLAKRYGGRYAAGDADDTFNKDLLPAAELKSGEAQWQVGWLGKVKMCFDMLKDDFEDSDPSVKITAIAIAGGPACDWERGQLRNNFMDKLPQFELKQIGDYEGYEMWLDKYQR